MKLAFDKCIVVLLQVFSVAHRFAENKALMASKDSKRIVKTYNRVAKALIEFETLWTQAWIRSIESAKAGLQSTLIVRHPTTGKHIWPVLLAWLDAFSILITGNTKLQQGLLHCYRSRVVSVGMGAFFPCRVIICMLCTICGRVQLLLTAIKQSPILHKCSSQQIY